jgi:hypothetical protein
VNAACLDMPDVGLARIQLRYLGRIDIKADHVKALFSKTQNQG